MCGRGGRCYWVIVFSVAMADCGLAVNSFLSKLQNTSMWGLTCRMRGKWVKALLHAAQSRWPVSAVGCRLLANASCNSCGSKQLQKEPQTRAAQTTKPQQHSP